MSGGANHSRLTSLTCPNGRGISYDFGTSGGLSDRISRLNSLKDGSTTLEGYSYLGLGTVVERLHPESGVDHYYPITSFMGYHAMMSAILQFISILHILGD
jgi:hypothetical protein